MSSSGTESDSSASSDVDFDDYGRGSECPTSGNREQPTSERHKFDIHWYSFRQISEEIMIMSGIDRWRAVKN